MNAMVITEASARRQELAELCRRADRVLGQELRRCGQMRPRWPEEKGAMMPTLYETRQGQAGRDAAARFARLLKQQGFLPTRHFVERFRQRVLERGLRFDPRTFQREFFAARHYRQTRPGYRTRIAVVGGVPVLYRRGGWSGERFVLVGVLPVGARPPVTPVSAPNREALFESGKAPSYSEKLAKYQACLQAYKPSGKRLPTRPGKAFRRAFQRPRQAYLGCQHLNPNAPGFMLGWYKQEQRRQALDARRRPKNFREAGQKQTASRRKQWQAIAADPKQSAAARDWARAQLRRLAEGQSRLKKLKSGRTLRKPKTRVTPGYDVGHPIGYLFKKGPGGKPVRALPRKTRQDPLTFRNEMAVQNQGRPKTARRRGLPWGFFESDPWG